MTATVQIIKTAEKSLGSVSLERSFIWWKKKHIYVCCFFLFFVFFTASCSIYVFLLRLKLSHRLFSQSSELLNIRKLKWCFTHREMHGRLQLCVLFCFVSVLLNQLHKLANITSLSCTGNRKVVVIVSLWFNLRKAAKACVFSNLYSFQKG